jgi:hypothetical protein
MIRFDSLGRVPDLTPCGRVPGTPLPGKHEIVANALVRGMTNYEAGVEANYKRGPGLAGNISRLRHTPEMRERMAEIAAIADEDARIENRWLVQDLNLFRKASLAHFWKRDVHGRLVLRRGKPIIDLSHATEEQLRTLSSLTVDRGKVKLELHKPMEAIDKLPRHRGLYDDERVDLMVNNTMTTQINRVIIRSEHGSAARERIAEHLEKIGDAQAQIGGAQGQEPAGELGEGSGTRQK